MVECDDFICKPYAIEELLKSVDLVINKKEAIVENSNFEVGAKSTDFSNENNNAGNCSSALIHTSGLNLKLCRDPFFITPAGPFLLMPAHPDLFHHRASG